MNHRPDDHGVAMPKEPTGNGDANVSGTVLFWCFPPDRFFAQLPRRQCAALLDPTERERWQRFHFEADRDLFLAAHALLRTALSAICPEIAPAAWQYDTQTHGKPVLAGAGERTGLRFNLTHTHGLAAVAIATGREVGIDAEGIDRRVDARGLAERFFAPAEAARLHAADPADQVSLFFTFWTLKEAYIKVTGAGLNKPLDSFSFRPEGNAIHFVDNALSDAEARRWGFALLDGGKTHRLAVAVRCGRGNPVRLQPGPPLRVAGRRLDAVEPSLSLRAVGGGMAPDLAEAIRHPVALTGREV